MRSRRKNTRSSSGRASRGDTGSWLHCWASQSRYFLCRSSMIRLLRDESGPWNWLEGAFCPNRLNLYRLIAHGRTWIGIPGQAPRGADDVPIQLSAVPDSRDPAQRAGSRAIFPLPNSDFVALIDYQVFRRRGHRAVFLRRISLIVYGVI